jgi:hypothetical protein
VFFGCRIENAIPILPFHFVRPSPSPQRESQRKSSDQKIILQEGGKRDRICAFKGQIEKKSQIKQKRLITNFLDG